MRKWIRKAALLLACCLLCMAAASAESMHTEKENPAFEMEVTIGYDGMMTYGKTMPARVRIRNLGSDFEGTLGMNAYISTKEYDRFETAVSLPAGSEREIVLAVTVYSRQDVFTAELVKDGEVVCAVNASPERTANPSAMLIGILSSRPQNLANLNIDRENDTLARYELWQTVPLTAETFPEDTDLLRSFGMLVVDDIDPATLSRKQQDTLDTWLRSGRIVLCSGGAAAGRNTAWFSPYTRLSLNGVTTSDTVIEALEGLIARAKSGRKVTAALAEYTGAEPLVRDAEGHGLVYAADAGAGRIYTAAFELGDPLLNAESLMHYFWQQLLVDQDQNLYNTVLYANAESTSDAMVIPGENIPVSARSGLPAGLLIVGGVLLLACAVWALLKRKDRQQWMWAVLPILSAAAAVCLMLLSGSSETNRPMAVATENLVQDSTGAIRSYSGIAAEAPAYGRHRYSKEGAILRLREYNDLNYFEDEEEEKKAEPTVLRTCYIAGGENAVTAESTQPWDRIALVSEGEAKIQGRLETAVWMEEDGLHGEIVNGTDVKLKAGYVVTSYGYAKVPALAPGEKAEVLLTKRTFADPTNPKYEEGGLYLETTMGIYSVASAVTGSDRALDGSREITVGSMITGAAVQMNRAKNGAGYGVYESAVFVYCAEPEEWSAPALCVDGEPVRQQTCISLLTAEMNYVTVGRTGVVFRSAGMDLPERVDTDENLMPTGKLTSVGKSTYYHNLNETPTFRFTLDWAKNVKIERMRVSVESYYVGQAMGYVLNRNTGAWDEFRLNEDIKNPDSYVDGEGRLYLQFRPLGQEMYADIPTPMIILEGRENHAEN